jgi:hypothetical protein
MASDLSTVSLPRSTGYSLGSPGEIDYSWKSGVTKHVEREVSTSALSASFQTAQGEENQEARTVVEEYDQVIEFVLSKSTYLRIKLNVLFRH